MLLPLCVRNLAVARCNAAENSVLWSTLRSSLQAILELWQIGTLQDTAMNPFPLMTLQFSHGHVVQGQHSEVVLAAARHARASGQAQVVHHAGHVLQAARPAGCQAGTSR